MKGTVAIALMTICLGATSASAMTDEECENSYGPLSLMFQGYTYHRYENTWVQDNFGNAPALRQIAEKWQEWRDNCHITEHVYRLVGRSSGGRE
jgi:hypothetical protein